MKLKRVGARYVGNAGCTGGGLSGRSQTIREAVGEDAPLKSRDVAALDTRKSKQHVDPGDQNGRVDADAEGNRVRHPGIS